MTAATPAQQTTIRFAILPQSTNPYKVKNSSIVEGRRLDPQMDAAIIEIAKSKGIASPEDFYLVTAPESYAKRRTLVPIKETFVCNAPLGKISIEAHEKLWRAANKDRDVPIAYLIKESKQNG